MGSVSESVSQMLNLFSKLHRLLHGSFRTVKWIANAIGAAQTKGLHQVAKRGNRQASRQPSRTCLGFAVCCVVV